MDPCQHVTKGCGVVHIREPKKAQSDRSCSSAARAFGESWNLSANQYHEPQFLITDSVQQIGNSLRLNTSPISSDNSAGLACNIHITRSTDSEEVELPIIGFNIAIYHNYDAEVGGRLKGHLKDTFKKRRFYFIKTSSPKKLQTVSVLSQSSRLVSLQNRTTERHTTSPCKSPRCNGKGKGVHSVLGAAHNVSPLGALPLPLSNVGRKQGTSRRRARCEPVTLGLEHVVSGVRRSRLGAASLNSAHAPWPVQAQWSSQNFAPGGRR